MTLPTTFVDGDALTARASETDGANWGTGGDWAGSNSPGIGINIDAGATAGTPEQFTLLDQNGDARTPQDGQSIGGVPFIDRSSVAWPSSGGVEGPGTKPIQAATPDDAGVGTPVPTGNATLASLAAGWTDPAV